MPKPRKKSPAPTQIDADTYDEYDRGIESLKVIPVGGHDGTL